MFYTLATRSTVITSNMGSEILELVDFLKVLELAFEVEVRGGKKDTLVNIRPALITRHQRVEY